MLRDLRTRAAACALLALLLGGCAAGPEPEAPAAPAAPAAATGRGASAATGDDGYLRIVSGASDSVGALVRSEDARYTFRYRQTQPGSANFNYRDRDLSFFFRPTPEAIHFQVENLRDRPVEIDWSRSTFLRPIGGTDGIAHSPTRWEDRFRTQANSTINGLQRYSDYVFPISSLVDPGGDRDRQLHRVLFPENEQALQMVDREFGMDLVFVIDGRPVTYPFRFRVASVIRQ